MKLLKSQSGMSLIEIMIAVSILSVISLSVVLLNKNMNKSVKDAEKKSDIDMISRDIMAALSDKDSCSATFSGITVPAASGSQSLLPSIKQYDGNGQVKPHARLKVVDIANAPGNATIINGMSIRRTNSSANLPGSGVPGDYELVVTFVKNPRAAVAANTLSRDTVFRNFVVKTFPLRLDDCKRTAAMANNSVGPVQSPSCAGPIGPVYQFYSSGSPTGKNYYSVQVCRNCDAKSVISGCL